MSDTNSLIYQTTQIRELEQLAIADFGISAIEMMERAGAASFGFLRAHFPSARTIAVCCGSGNNGGDGYVLARILKEHGYHVCIWQVGDHKKSGTKESAHAKKLCETAAITMHTFEQAESFKTFDLLVDAICGIGIKSKLRPSATSVIEKMNASGVPILAIDLPSGLNADTGEILGCAVKANATITFIGMKLGLLTGSGVAQVGHLAHSDLQLPAALFSMIKPVCEIIGLNTFSKYLKPRTRNWHKGLSGHVLIVGGDLGYGGAPRMAAIAALRVGAGLVTVATRSEHAATLNVTYPEIMCRGIAANQDLEELVQKADVIVLGPGLGQSAWSLMVWKFVVSQHKPIVLDADGLNLLAKSKLSKDNWILTPHPGEASRLLKSSIPNIEDDRLFAVTAIGDRFGGVSVLKGAGTLVYAKGKLPALCDKGNPGLATAGTGDVLSGVIGGLLGQGVPLFAAAKLGVLLHALAADLAAKDGERGMIATDLMPYLRQLSNL